MPEFLVKKLQKAYPNNPSAVYGTLNKIGAMRGNKETKKGKQMEDMHNKKMSKLRMYASGMGG